MSNVTVVYGEVTDTQTANKFYRAYALPGYLVTHYGRIGTDGTPKITPNPSVQTALHAAVRSVLAKKLAQAKDNYVASSNNYSEFPVDMDDFRRHYNAGQPKAAVALLERAFAASQRRAANAGTNTWGTPPVAPRTVQPRPAPAPMPAPPVSAGVVEVLIADAAALMTLTVTDPDKALVHLGILRGRYQELQAQMRTIQGYLDTADDVLHLKRPS